MASRIETDLIVRAIAEGFDRVVGELEETGRAAKRAGDEVGKGGDGAKSAGMKWTELRSAVGLAQLAFNQALGAAKQVYAFLQEGAAIDLAQTKFDRLAGSIGTTATALERDMGDAIGGMLSQSESMALASDLMSLGLAKTHDQTVRLSRVASSLNMDMNQLVLTLSNRTTMRFDSLGVAVDGFDSRLDQLKATGLSVEDAFTEAFLQQAEEQITKVGEVADTAAGKLQRLENQAKDTGDAFKLSLLNAIEPVLDRHIQLIDAEQQLERAFSMGAVGLDDYNKMQRELARGGTAAATAIVEHTDALIEQRQAAYDAATAEDELRRAMSEGVTPAVKEASQAILDYEARREGIWTQETLEIKFGADTESAETEVEDFITRLQGRALELQLAIRGQEDIWQQLGIGLQGDQRTAIDFSAASAESFDAEGYARVLEEKLTGVWPGGGPEIAPVVDDDELIMLESKLGDVGDDVDDINATDVAPPVDDKELQDLITDIGVGQDALNDLVAQPYNVETESNVGELNEQLLTTLGLVQSIAGTHNVNFVMGGTGASPHSGPYDTGGAAAGGGSTGGPVINNNFIGTSPQENAQYLQDRGMLPRTTFR